jgi:hypothetical protein
MASSRSAPATSGAGTQLAQAFARYRAGGGAYQLLEQPVEADRIAESELG